MKNKEQLFLIILAVAIVSLTIKALHERRDPLILRGVKARYVAIPSTGRDINSPSSYFFGKAQYFIISDRAKGTYRVIHNKFADDLHAAGLKASQMLINLDVDAVCANNIGFEQARLFHAANIEMYTNVRKTPMETLKAFPNNLMQITEKNASLHADATNSRKPTVNSRLNVYANTAEITQGKFFVCYQCGYHLKSMDISAENGRQNVCLYCGGGLHQVIAVSTPKASGLKPKIKVF